MSVRSDVIDAICANLKAQPWIRTVEYDRPFSLEGGEYPRAWVYDFDERYDFSQYAGRTMCQLTAGILVAYRYDEREGVRATGNRILADLLASVCTDQNERDPAQVGVNFVALPRESDVFDAAERTQQIGCVTMVLDVEYDTHFGNPYTQNVA